MSFPKVILHPGKERSVLNHHPWLFSGAVKKIDGAVNEGDVVEIFSSDQKYLATGHFHEGSIQVRIFSFEQVEPGFEFWKSRLEKALHFRRQVNLAGNQLTNCYRLIHAEGDGLPGLII